MKAILLTAAALVATNAAAASLKLRSSSSPATSLKLRPGSSPATSLKLGDRAPPFELPSLIGESISSRRFSGKPTVLVIGTAKESAHACREWMLTLHRNFEGTDSAVYQVIVLNNPWYIPNFMVINEIKGFVPEYGHHLVLLEWKTHFGDLFGIPYDFDPRVLVLDDKGSIRMWHRGDMTDEALSRVITLITELGG